MERMARPRDIAAKTRRYSAFCAQLKACAAEARTGSYAPNHSWPPSNERIKPAWHAPEVLAKLRLLDRHVREILLIRGLEGSRDGVGPGQRQESAMILSQLGYLQLRSIDVADDDRGKFFIVVHPRIAVDLFKYRASLHLAQTMDHLVEQELIGPRARTRRSAGSRKGVRRKPYLRVAAYSCSDSRGLARASLDDPTDRSSVSFPLHLVAIVWELGDRIRQERDLRWIVE